MRLEHLLSGETSERMVRKEPLSNESLVPAELFDKFGGLAQLARAPALHAGGQRFESVILHNSVKERRSLTYCTKKEYKKQEELKV